MKHDLHNAAPPELQRAVWEGEAEAVKAALISGVDPNALGEYGDPLLVVASRQGHLVIVRMLLEHGAEVNLGTQNGSALRQAILCNHSDIAEMLLEAGAAVTWHDAEMAASHGQTQLLETFIKRQHNTVNQLEGLGSTAAVTLVLSASFTGEVETVQALIDWGADVNMSNENGWTALLAAASNGKTEAVRLLLNAGANPEAADKSGETPLMRAAHQGHQEIVMLLKEAGAQQ